MRIVIDKTAIKEIIDQKPELFAEIEGGLKEAIKLYVADRKNLVTTAMQEEFSRLFGQNRIEGFQLTQRAREAVTNQVKHDADKRLADSDQISLLINSIINDKIKLAIKRGVEERLIEIAKGIVRGTEKVSEEENTG